MKTTPPKVSLLLRCGAAGPELDQTLRSVLRQSFGDFELIVCCDRGDPLASALARDHSDPRIRVAGPPASTGPQAEFAHGLQLARGRYLAWISAGTFSRPHRLARQVALLDSDPVIGVCGTQCRAAQASPTPAPRLPGSHEGIQANLLLGLPAFEPCSVLMRRAPLEVMLHGAAARATPPDDFEPWVDLILATRFHNLADCLVELGPPAPDGAQPTASRQALLTSQRQAALLLRLLPAPTPDQRATLEVLLRENAPSGHGFLRRAEELLRSLLEANRLQPLLPPRSVRYVIGRLWTTACVPNRFEGTRLLATHLAARLLSWREPRHLREIARLTRAVWRARPRTTADEMVVEPSGPCGDQLFHYALALSLLHKPTANPVLDLSHYARYRHTPFVLPRLSLRHRAATYADQIPHTSRRLTSGDGTFPPARNAPPATHVRGHAPLSPWSAQVESRLRREIVWRGSLSPAGHALRKALAAPQAVLLHVKAAEWKPRARHAAAPDAWPVAAPEGYFARAWAACRTTLPEAQPVIVTDLPTAALAAIGLPATAATFTVPELDRDPETWWVSGTARHCIVSASAGGWWTCWRVAPAGAPARVFLPREWNGVPGTRPAPWIPSHWSPL